MVRAEERLRCSVELLFLEANQAVPLGTSLNPSYLTMEDSVRRKAIPFSKWSVAPKMGGPERVSS